MNSLYEFNNVFTWQILYRINKIYMLVGFILRQKHYKDFYKYAFEYKIYYINWTNILLLIFYEYNNE